MFELGGLDETNGRESRINRVSVNRQRCGYDNQYQGKDEQERRNMGMLQS